ncbi:hypothetical protein STENM327S_03493 [Streptomyces tendae]
MWRRCITSDSTYSPLSGPLPRRCRSRRVATGRRGRRGGNAGGTAPLGLQHGPHTSADRACGSRSRARPVRAPRQRTAQTSTGMDGHRFQPQRTGTTSPSVRGRSAGHRDRLPTLGCRSRRAASSWTCSCSRHAAAMPARCLPGAPAPCSGAIGVASPARRRTSVPHGRDRLRAHFVPEGAAWHLQISGELDNATMGSLLLLVNEQNKVTAVAFEKRSPTPPRRPNRALRGLRGRRPEHDRACARQPGLRGRLRLPRRFPGRHATEPVRSALPRTDHHLRPTAPCSSASSPQICRRRSEIFQAPMTVPPTPGCSPPKPGPFSRSCDADPT